MLYNLSPIPNTKGKNVDNYTLQLNQKPVLGPFIATIEKEVRSMQKQWTVKNGAALKCLSEKSCEMKGISQAMATNVIF